MNELTETELRYLISVIQSNIEEGGHIVKLRMLFEIIDKLEAYHISRQEADNAQ